MAQGKKTPCTEKEKNKILKEVVEEFYVKVTDYFIEIDEHELVVERWRRRRDKKLCDEMTKLSADKQTNTN